MYIRQCPNCNGDISYQSKKWFTHGAREGTWCVPCRNRERYKVPESAIETVLAMHAQLSSTKEIAEAVKLSGPVVSRILAKQGLRSHSLERGLRKHFVRPGVISCGICGKDVAVEDLPGQKAKNGKFYKLARCKECHWQINNRSLEASPEAFIHARIKHTRAYAKKFGVPFAIDDRYIVALYYNQQSLCFYSGEKLTHQIGKGYARNSISIDRVVPARGYVPGNLVLCMRKVNLVKNDLTLDEIQVWMPGWYQRLESAGFIEKEEVDEAFHTETIVL
jgi:hypothetical protein